MTYEALGLTKELASSQIGIGPVASGCGISRLEFRNRIDAARANLGVQRMAKRLERYLRKMAEQI